MFIDKEWIPVISAIAGGLIGFTGAFLQQTVSRKAERRKLIREKLEEVYLLSEQVQKWAYDTCGWMTKVQIDFYLEVADTRQPLPREKFAEKIMPLDAINESSQKLRSAVEKAVQRYI